MLLDALMLVIVYGNLSVVLQPPPLRSAGFVLPRPAWMLDAFLIPGMFSSYSATNHDFLITGERTQRGLHADRGRWIKLRVREHFSERHGVVFTRLYVAHHWDVHGQVAQYHAWEFLARRIREHHNRLHPERAVARVRLGSIEWPLSPQGYRGGKRPGQVRTRRWFEERVPR